MAVIGSHWNAPIHSILTAAPDFLTQQLANNPHHIDASCKMLGFIERAICFARNLPEVGKVNPWSKLTNHRDQIVIFPGAERTNAEGRSVHVTIKTCKDSPNVIRGRHYPWNAK